MSFGFVLVESQIHEYTGVIKRESKGTESQTTGGIGVVSLQEVGTLIAVVSHV